MAAKKKSVAENAKDTVKAAASLATTRTDKKGDESYMRAAAEDARGRIPSPRSMKFTKDNYEENAKVKKTSKK